MGVRNASAGTTTIVNASFASGVEGVVFTTGLVGLVQDNAQVIIQWELVFNYGTTTTVPIVRIRRGSGVTGAQVNITNGYTMTPATLDRRAGTYIDTPGVVGQIQYSLTVQVAGGGTNTAVNDGCLIMYVL